jgi:transposase InsO family protein
MTNMASAYRSRPFADAVATTGLRHIQTRPYMPRTNDKAERFILSSLTFPLLCGAAVAVLPWTNQYNYSRPHSPSAVLHPISRIATDSLLGHDS